MAPTITQQVLDGVMELGKTLDLHVAADKANVEKVNAMYKIIVTGNGQPSLPETVRVHEAWIEERKTDLKTEFSEARDFHRQMIALFIGQVLTFIALGIAVYIGWR